MFSNHNFVIISDSPISTLKMAKLNPCSVQVTQCPQWTKQIAELPKKTDKKNPKVGGFLQCLGMQVVVLSTGGILPLLGRIVSCSEE